MMSVSGWTNRAAVKFNLMVLVGLIVSCGMGIGRAVHAAEPVIQGRWTEDGEYVLVTPEGEVRPIDSTNIQQAEGKAGRGLLVMEGEHAPKFEDITSFNWNEGTVSFWLKPTWYGNMVGPNGYVFFQATGRPHIQSYLHIGCLGKNKMDAKLQQAGRREMNPHPKIGEWVADEWHHVAVTWDDTSTRIYIDGKYRGGWNNIKREKQFPENARTEITVGARGSRQTPAKGVLDEMRIYDRALEREGVGELYDSQAQVAAELLFPDRVPLSLYPDETLDGRVTNYTGAARDLTVRTRVTDLSRPEYEVQTESERTISLEPGESAKVGVYDPSEQRAPYGLFEGRVTVLEDGERVARRTHSFGCSVRPPDLSEVEDSIFGTIGGPGKGTVSANGSQRSYSKQSVEPNKMLGQKWLRVNFAWHLVEPEQDEWNWKNADRVVASAQKHGVKIMGTLNWAPNWARSEDLKWAPGFQVPHDESFKDYVHTIAKRYRGKVNHWSIGNEPAFKSRKHARRFYETVKIASEAIKRANPDAKIIMEPRGERSQKWLFSFEDGALSEYVDIFSDHFYYQSDWPETQIPAMRRFRKSLQKHLDGPFQTWDTEGGKAAAERRTNRPLSPERLAIEIEKGNRQFWWMHWAVTEWEQAGLVVRDYATKWGEGMSTVFLQSFGDFATARNIGAWRDGVPLVGAIALTCQTNLLCDGEFVRKVAGSDNVKSGRFAYMFRTEEGERVLMCWTPRGERALNLQIDQKTVEATDMFGNPRSYEPVDGVLRMEVSEWPIYLRDVPEDVELVPEWLSASLDARLVPTGESVTYEVEIENPFREDLEADMSVKAPEGWTVSPEAEEVSVSPGQTQSHTFEIAVPEGTENGEYDLTLEMVEPSGMRSKKQGIVMVKTAEEAVRISPTIDGDLSDWKGVPSYTIQSREQVKIGLVSERIRHIQPHREHEDPWKGPQDLSGRFRVGWDERNLYVACRVGDDDVLHRRRFSQYEMGDGVEIYVDNGGGIVLVDFIPSTEDYDRATWGARKVWGNICGSVRAASRRTEEGYVMEIALPWVNAPRISPELGGSIGLDVALNDADENYDEGKNLKNKMVWHGTRDNHASTRRYGLMELVEGPGEVTADGDQRAESRWSEARPLPEGTGAVPGKTYGKTSYPEGKYGSAIQAQSGLSYPASRKVYSTAEGTLSLWVKPDRPDSPIELFYDPWNTLLVASPWRDRGFYKLVVRNQDPDRREHKDQQATAQMQRGSRLIPGTWNHVVITWSEEYENDPHRGKGWVFINGERADGHSWAVRSEGKQPDRIFFGRRAHLKPYGFFRPGEVQKWLSDFENVRIDEIVLLDRLIWEKQVRQMYFGGPHEPNEHTRLYVNFDRQIPDGQTYVRKKEK